MREYTQEEKQAFVARETAKREIRKEINKDKVYFSIEEKDKIYIDYYFEYDSQLVNYFKSKGLRFDGQSWMLGKDWVYGGDNSKTLKELSNIKEDLNKKGFKLVANSNMLQTANIKRILDISDSQEYVKFETYFIGIKRYTNILTEEYFNRIKEEGLF